MTQISMIPTFDTLRQSELDAERIVRNARAAAPEFAPALAVLAAAEIARNPELYAAAKPSRRPRRQPVNVADSTPF